MTSGQNVTTVHAGKNEQDDRYEHHILPILPILPLEQMN